MAYIIIFKYHITQERYTYTDNKYKRFRHLTTIIVYVNLVTTISILTKSLYIV